MSVLSWGTAGDGAGRGLAVGMVNVFLLWKRSRSDEIFRVGEGTRVVRGEGIAVGVTVMGDVGTSVGVIVKNRVGMVIAKDEPVRWFEIRSPALTASTGVHTITRMNMDIINGENFIGIPRGN